MMTGGFPLAQSMLFTSAVLNNTIYDASNTGLKARLSRRGMDYAAAIGEIILEQEIKIADFPEFNVPVYDGPGHGLISVGGLKVLSIKSPTFTYETSPPHGLVIHSKGGYLNVHGSWTAWYKALIKIYLSGSVTASASDLTLKLSASVSRTSRGLPQLHIHDCSAGIGTLNVDISGGVVEWFINIFRGSIAKRIRYEISTLMCKSAQGPLLEFLNGKLAALPTCLPLEDDFLINYGLTADPVASKDYVEGYLKTEITWEGENRTLVHPAPLPNVTTPTGSETRMLYIWGSDSILNTFLYSAHHHQTLQFTVTKDLGKEARHVLRTSCSMLCLGSLIPQLHRKYPKRFVDIVIGTKNPPEARVQRRYAVLNGTAFADLYLNPWNETGILLASAEIDISGDLKISMRGRRVVGQFKATQFNLRIVRSTIGTIPSSAIGSIEDVAKPVLTTLANGLLRRGLKIPTFEGLRLIRPKLTMMDRSVQIASDLAYKLHYGRKVIGPYKDRVLKQYGTRMPY